METPFYRLRAAPRRALAGTCLAAVALCALGLRAEAQSLPPPPLTLLQNSGSLGAGYNFIGPTATALPNPSNGPEILDSQGRVVWFSQIRNDQVASDFRVQTYQGKPVLTWSQSSGYGVANPVETVDYILDNTYQVVATVHGSNFNADMHEFQLTPQNTALILVYNTTAADLTSVGGPANGTVTEGVVQEIDVPTGKVLLEWHSLTDVALSESYLPAPTAAGTPYDYFHVNSASLDTDGNILVSSRHCWTVYKINRTTGAVIWRLGGKSSDFAMGPGTAFAWQHDAEAVDASTIRIFDNESNGTPQLPYSRVIWVTHDDVAKTASIARSIIHPAQISALAEGSAQSLDNGNTFVDWGILGRISEFDPAGAMLYDAVEPAGYGSYRGYRFPWVAAPATGPTATAVLNGDGTLSVHAVWNGATEVASWQVLGGSSSANLGVVASGPWNGADTVITLPAAVGAVEVAALDASGLVLATSAPSSGPFPPAFPTEPASPVVHPGGTVVFTGAAAAPSVSYQWMLNGTPLADGSGVSGATTGRLEVSGATNPGTYTLVATGLAGAVTSAPATLSIATTANPGRLINASCRANVGIGDNALIIGLAVGGAGTEGTERMLVRATGPELTLVGVPGVLGDPKLQLYGSGGLIASDASAGPQSTGSQVLYSSLRDFFAAGPYTAVVTGASGDSGLALAEIFDVKANGSRTPTSPRLVNISGRALVGAGSNALIAGFVIGGTTSETVLVRASGPALGKLGVAGVLPDPQVQLFQSNPDGSSTPLGTNSGWNADPQISSAAASVGAFTWGPDATPDAALLVTLPPGSYTAVVSGVGGDGGLSLVEVYEIP